MEPQPTQPDALKRSRQVRHILIAALAVAAVTALTITLYKSRHYVLPKRFAEVVSGELYRSGQMKPWPMQRTLDQYNIRTVVSMMKESEFPDWQKVEQQMIRERDIQFVRIPMNGNGVSRFDDFRDLEKAAAILQGEPVDGVVYPRPVLLHCAAGVCRTGSSYAVWRMKYHGWDADRAIAEARTHGKISPLMIPHLRQYHAERIATTRPAE